MSIKFYNRFLILPENSIAKQAFLLSKSLYDHQKPCYHTYLHQMLACYDIENPLNSTQAVASLENRLIQMKNKYFQYWKKELENSRKLNVYKLIKTDYEIEDYLTLIRDFDERQTFTKFRVSNHKLAIETGRYGKQNTQRNQRLCVFCDRNEIETEEHMFKHCPLYQDLRLTLYEKTGPGVENNDMLFFISSRDKNILFYTSKFLSNCFKLRNEISQDIT